MGCIKKPWFNTLAVIICLLGLAGLSANMAFAANATGGWKWKADARIGVSYDTNVFKLSSIQIDRKDQNLTKDQTTGRYKDMDSVGDIIFTPRVRATFSRKGLMGKKLSVRPSIAYNKYVQDQEKSYFDFGLDINQKVGKRGDLGLEFGYAPNIYKKNFISGAVDTDNTPSAGISTTVINGTEKVFSPAHYDDTVVILSYSRSLWKNHGKHRRTLSPDAVSAKIFAGYENKNYDDPFTNRTEDDFLAGFDLDVALHKKTSLTLSYLFKKVNTTVKPELLIRNETNFGVDLNGDGDVLDLSVATQQNVDRSRDQHSVGVKVSRRLQKGWDAYAKYEARFTSYKSNEQFDVTRLNRDDTRQKFGVGLKGEIASNWLLAVNWVNTSNHAKRSGLVLVDKTEVKSYNINVYSAVVSYLF